MTPEVSDFRASISPVKTLSDDQVYDAAMAEATKLGLMSDGKATERAQCPTCEAVFSTAGPFDRHLTRNATARTSPGPGATAASVGLVRTFTGVWLQPGSDDAEFLQNRAS